MASAIRAPLASSAASPVGQNAEHEPTRTNTNLRAGIRGKALTSFRRVRREGTAIEEANPSVPEPPLGDDAPLIVVECAPRTVFAKGTVRDADPTRSAQANLPLSAPTWRSWPLGVLAAMPLVVSDLSAWEIHGDSVDSLSGVGIETELLAALSDIG